jgi:hypothetical protein
MADYRVVTGVSLALSLEALHTFQLLLPPLYGEEKSSPEHIRKAVKFNAVYILLIGAAAGIVTRNPAPVLLPAITLAVAYYLYMNTQGNHVLASIMDDEGEE